MISDFENTHGEEHERLAGWLAKLIKGSFLGIKRYFIALIIIVFGCMAIITWSTVVTQQTAENTKQISQESNRFLENFSNYMTCLIVNEDEVVIAVGEEAYVEICKALLFRGIKDVPPTIKAEIPNS